MMGHMRPAADSYTYDVGVGTPSEIRDRTTNILRTFGYDVVRDDGSEKVYMETQWQKRDPVDEQERQWGHEIISRVQVTGAPRFVRGAPTLYHALVTVENRSSSAVKEVWLLLAGHSCTGKPGWPVVFYSKGEGNFRDCRGYHIYSLVQCASLSG